MSLHGRICSLRVIAGEVAEMSRQTAKYAENDSNIGLYNWIYVYIINHIYIVMFIYQVKTSYHLIQVSFSYISFTSTCNDISRESEKSYIAKKQQKTCFRLKHSIIYFRSTPHPGFQSPTGLILIFLGSAKSQESQTKPSWMPLESYSLGGV